MDCNLFYTFTENNSSLYTLVVGYFKIKIISLNHTMQIKVLLKVTVIRQSLLLQLFRNSVCHKIVAIEFSVDLVAVITPTLLDYFTCISKDEGSFSKWLWW